LLTPDTSWIPWEDGGAASFTPGIRPRIEFDPGETIAIVGYQDDDPPYWGAELWSNVDYEQANTVYWNTIGFFAVYEYNTYWYQKDPWHRFIPPLILPAGLFLTVVPENRNLNLAVSWRYREIG
jgi:hypothetical protein